MHETTLLRTLKEVNVGFCPWSYESQGSEETENICLPGDNGRLHQAMAT